MTARREPERLYTTREVADLCSVSLSTVERAIKRTDPPFLRAKKVTPGSRAVRIPASAVAEWQAQMEDA